MSTGAEPPPPTTTTTPAAPANKVSPVTYVIIPLVTLASVFLVGLFAYIRRRHSRRHLLDGNGDDGGEAQMQERRRGHDTGSAADRWPPASLGFNWWFLRSHEGLNELGQAPPPYIGERRNKVPSEGGDNDHVIEEENENGTARRSGESIRESTRHGGEHVRSPRSRDGRRSSEEPTRASTQEEQAPHHTHRTEDEPQETSEQVPPAEILASPHLITPPASSDPSSSSSSPPRDNGRQPPSEMVSIIESRRLRSQIRRSARAITTTSTSTSSSPTDDTCSSEFFRSASASPERSGGGRRRHHIERLNRRLRHLGYVTSETTEYHGFQLRDMENGAAPPGYERVPDVAVPPPAQLPRPPAADAPPPYPLAAPRWQRPPIILFSAPRRRDDERERERGPPMVRQTPPPQHEHFLAHHYLFMPPLEPDYLGTGFSASLDMPRHLHSRF